MLSQDRFAWMLIASREEAGLSQNTIAKILRIHPRTVQKWEAGETAPSAEILSQWFGACGVNAEYYWYRYWYPSIFDNKELGKFTLEEMRNALITLVQGMSEPELAAILYIYTGKHGSSPVALLQEAIANLHTPLPSRVAACSLVVSSYDVAAAAGTDPDPDGFQPDMEILRKALAAGHNAASSGLAGYTAGGGGL